MVTVVMPCGPLVVVVIRRVVVVVGAAGCVVVAAIVVGIVVGSRVTDVFVVVVNELPPGGVLLAGGPAELAFALNVATVASTVDRATPDAASRASARDLARLSVGGAIWPRSGESVTSSP
jgi:hypothetical protein